MLVLAGASALFLSLPIAIAIALLLTVVSISYRQEIYAYPSGGGDYAVARANLPAIFALIVAGALLVDYIMTVAVSTSSAVEQVISAVPSLIDIRVEIAVVAIILIMIGNLRGLRESGNIFAIPTYLFAGSTLLMIVIGTVQHRRARGEHAAADAAPGSAGSAPGRHDPAPHPSVRLRLRGADRNRGDRQRRPRLPAAGAAQRRNDADQSWRSCSACCSSGSRSSPTRSASSRSTSRP